MQRNQGTRNPLVTEGHPAVTPERKTPSPSQCHVFQIVAGCNRNGVSSARNDRDRLSFGNDIVELDEQRCDRAGCRRGHRYLHLHGFDHHNFIAIRNGSSNLHGSCADASRDFRDDLNFWHATAFLLSPQNA
ncbi:hypothetical protein UP06_03735 [Bradyrhizobium sp. LTSP857]|nr:hypothetical protein UP06_03735 [Bradyrhizobium sp. LTSP857]